MLKPIYRPTTNMDILRLPLIGPLLRWRWGRLPFQILLLVLAGLMIYDGFTGPQLAPSNAATVLAWVHYRGLIVLALLLAGNLFCFGCPFTIPRTIARNLSASGIRWPRRLRNKWVSIAGLLFIFWLYEWLDLWASPLLTAWIVLAYFAGSFLLEALFRESPFCKYVCPLGTFNFALSTASPLQIRAADQTVCKECATKECVNGSAHVLGCGTELYVPMIDTNWDCTFCLDCARACPYDNVALSPRQPLAEFFSERWPPRWDHSFLVVSLAFFAILNAFGMVPPMRALQGWLSAAFGLTSEALLLLLIFSLGSLLLPLALILGSSWLSSRLSPSRTLNGLKFYASRYAPSFVPLGIGIWFAHYGFHFALGGLTIIPVLHSLALDHGVQAFGPTPNWDLGFLLPMRLIFPIQVLSVLAGFFASLLTLARASLNEPARPLARLKQLLPWAIPILILTIAALTIFNLPMEMRGSLPMNP